jgi:diacylglycerol kinase (ATP)
MDSKRFSFPEWFAGFRHAFDGVRLLIRNERNAAIHCLIGMGVVVAGFLLEISVAEWMAVVIACGCVFAAEALNTAIERLSDVVSPEYSEAIKKVKDLSAGAVLLIALAAAIVGLIIFLPKLLF